MFRIYNESSTHREIRKENITLFKIYFKNLNHRVLQNACKMHLTGKNSRMLKIFIEYLKYRLLSMEFKNTSQISLNGFHVLLVIMKRDYPELKKMTNNNLISKVSFKDKNNE